VEHFKSASAGASAHVVIDRSGKLWQVVPFNRAAWHAGVSAWGGRQFLNGFSIGIELDNAGKLQQVGTRYQAWFGAFYEQAEVVRARHKFEDVDAFWHAYTEAQITALLELSHLLVSTYSLKDVVGHDDIAPTRKVDPGPAFPMNSFRSALFGRAGERGVEYRVNTPLLNVRSGPGSQFALAGEPLTAGARLSVLEMRDLWAHVLLLERAQTDGWVRNSFITLVS
jgi:N-acetylmuramoyl-L-alanine amidase